jgi:hypothetical protein
VPSLRDSLHPGYDSRHCRAGLSHAVPSALGLENCRCLPNLRPHHLKSLGRPGVLNPAHAAYEVQRISI